MTSLEVVGVENSIFNINFYLNHEVQVKTCLLGKAWF